MTKRYRGKNGTECLRAAEDLNLEPGSPVPAPVRDSRFDSLYSAHGVLESDPHTLRKRVVKREKNWGGGEKQGDRRKRPHLRRFFDTS